MPTAVSAPCLSPLPMRETDRTGWLSRLARVPWGGWSFAVAAMGLAFSYHGADPDLWGHVQYGRDAWEVGLPATATYTFTAAGHPWINHEHFSELLFAWLVDHAGISSLLRLKIALGLGVLALVVWQARQSAVGWPIVTMTVVMLAGVLTCYWPVRPQVFSYSLFALVIWLLTSAFADWRSGWPWLQREQCPLGPGGMDTSGHSLRRLWLVPVLFAIWANTHGAFVAGLAVFVSYVTLRGVEGLAAHGRHGAGWFLRMMVLAVAALAATLINPYGTQLPLWLLRTLSVPRPEINDWHALRVDHAVFLPTVLLASATVVGWLVSRRARDGTHGVILLCVLWQGVMHHRHLPFFAILAAFWLPVHWESAWQRFTQAARERVSTDRFAEPVPGRFPSWLSIGLWIGTATLVGVLATRSREVVVDRAEYPVTAMQFIRDRGLQGRMVVTFNWAQYAIAALGRSDAVTGAATRVGFDGRFRTCYPQIVIDEHLDFVLGNDRNVPRFRGPTSPPPDRSAVLGAGSRAGLHQPAAAALRPDHGRAAARLDVAVSGSAVADMGTSGIFDDPRNPRYLPTASRSLSDAVQSGKVAWPALPTSDGVRLSSGTRPPTVSTPPLPVRKESAGPRPPGDLNMGEWS